MSGTHEDKMPGVKAELKSKYTHKPSRMWSSSASESGDLLYSRYLFHGKVDKR